jgi:hypothetical protein
MYITVSCYTLAGAFADSAFTALFLTRGYNSGAVTYLWANDSSATDYMPNAFYANRSDITIHRSSAGHYLVRLPFADPAHGNIQVSGYNGGPCHTGETSSDGTALIVGVVCPRGDARFDLLYTKDVGLDGVPRPKAAYLRAYPLRPAGTRTPAEFRYSSVGGIPNLTRSGVGTYVVTLPGMPKGGLAHVTAGPGADLCYLASIRTSDTPQKVGVTCRNLGGALSDAAFDLSYTR